MLPENYSNRILIVICGLSPQILTETLYGLTVLKTSPFLPTRIILITTKTGKHRAELMLLRDQAHFFKLCEDYELGKIPFSAKDILVIPDNNGDFLDDIRSQNDNQCAADFIIEVIRNNTVDMDTAVHLSLAGGRKTMGFYAGYALSILGRVQDRLSHVLISDNYENHPDFFYPTKTSKVLHLESGPIDSKDAQITLADIPFIRLRDKLPSLILDSELSFSGAVELANLAYQPKSLLINFSEKKITASGIVLEMTPASFAFYAMHARDAFEQEGGFERPETDYQGLQLSKLMLSELAKYYGEKEPPDDVKELCELLIDLDADSKIIDNLSGGMRKNYTSERASEIERKILKPSLGYQLAEYYKIKGLTTLKDGNKRRTLFGISLGPEEITIIEPD